MIGTSLGPYRITAKLGAGGMGEVYRARDTKLDRDVAIKILPESFAHDAERVARFQREAKVLASLNHPNIAQIYGLEERALVMELVEGPTLADPIDHGALPLDEALNIGKQIAEALEAAHEKGITHRDLKPANIKLRPDGTVKVLDFGLATAAQSATGDDANATISPTITVDYAGTRAGMIMGTAAYMSPEQASGKPVDKRSDIWSFGVVLWEMLTGRRLFEGETVSHVMAAVLTKEPDLNAVPPKMRLLLQRCLEKDPKRRLRDIGDWQLLLQEAPSASASSAARFGTLGWIAAALLLVVTALLTFVHFREKPAETRVVSSILLPPEGAEFSFRDPSALPTLSPDGRCIVFGAKPKNGKTTLWLRQLDSPSAQPLPETGDAVLPFWSPDSRWVAFGQGDKLKKIDVRGGPPVVITDLHGPFRGGNWNREGVILFGTLQDGSHGLFRVTSSGGMASAATTLEKQSGNHLFPWFLPDGRHFLYTSRETGDIPVRVGSLDEPGQAGKVVAQASSNAVYAQGHLLYLRENTLMALPFDLNRLETTGEAVPLAEGVPTYTQPSRGAAFSVSATGLLVYQTGDIPIPSKIVWKDRQGKTLGDLGESLGRIFAIALSPDRQRLAVQIVDLNRKEDIWVYELGSGIPTRFSFDPTAASDPVWSSDGSMLYFTSDRRGQWDLFRKPSNGASTEELVLGDSATKYPESVSPDGKLLLYSRRDDKTGYDLWVLPLEQTQAAGKPEPRPFSQGPSNQTVSQFSPDGHWVAYQSEESGHYEVYVAPFPGPGGKRQVSYGGGALPRWRRDGKELFYLTDGKLMAAEITITGGTLQVGRVQKLFDVMNTRGYDVSADGQKFVMTEDTVTSSAPPLTLLQNWPAALRK